MKARDKYIKEMREYWQQTRGSGISGTVALMPDNFDGAMGEYYDNNIDPNRECELCGQTMKCKWCECDDCKDGESRGSWLCPSCYDPMLEVK